MFGHIDIFQLATGLARHSSARQATIAANIANADTPGYRAADIKPFNESYRTDSATRDATSGLRATRPGHIPSATGAVSNALNIENIDRSSGASPNGNTVSIEAEMVHSVNAQRAHNRAVTIYQTSLDILRSSLRSGR